MMVLQQAVEVDPELERRFDELVEQWIRARRGASVRIHEHPAYDEILAMGPPAIPLILQHLRDHGWHWQRLLRELTGENPVPEGEFDRQRTRELWREWGEGSRTDGGLGWAAW